MEMTRDQRENWFKNHAEKTPSEYQEYLERPATAADTRLDAERLEIGQLLSRFPGEYEQPAAVEAWAAGFRGEGLAALVELRDMPIARRLIACKIELLNAVQCSDLFECTLNRWLVLSKQGATPAPDTPCPHWSRATLATWAAGGCRRGGTGEPIAELLGQKLSSIIER